MAKATTSKAEPSGDRPTNGARSAGRRRRQLAEHGVSSYSNHPFPDVKWKAGGRTGRASDAKEPRPYGRGSSLCARGTLTTLAGLRPGSGDFILETRC
jgi:hypothetical protein